MMERSTELLFEKRKAAELTEEKEEFDFKYNRIYYFWRADLTDEIHHVIVRCSQKGVVNYLLSTKAKVIEDHC